MVRHRTHSIEFKRQVVQDYLAGETLHGLAKRHDLSRNLVRIWIQKFEAGAFDDEASGHDRGLRGQDCSAGAARRTAGFDIEFLKGALKHGPRPRSATTSVITGPGASPSSKFTAGESGLRDVGLRNAGPVYDI